MNAQDKIKKLLELARGKGNAAEAAAAFGHAQRIATKYNLRLDLEDDAIAPVMELTIFEGKKMVPWRMILAGEIAQANNCRSFGGRFKNSVKIIACGQDRDLSTVAYMFAAISNEIDSLAKTAGAGKGQKFARDFRIGCAAEIGARIKLEARNALEQARIEAHQQPEDRLALVLAANVRAAEASAAAQRHLDGKRAVTRPAKAARMDGYTAGRVAASAMTIRGSKALP